ncbi:hypothetical protein [Colwellia sp. MB02u-14]|uniref:hypothetical protein n=1 Tax=Colwellia sp. MB02u-14 TaxID=2759815 RepID=UPI0015F77920|nr:hypothetical protein [Colwellia sp. MB02u-14]MBA6304923.1 hypothetical protein [Colwellia sp. MB02u-14]
MRKSKTPNFTKHYVCAVFKTCLDIIELNTISSAKKHTKKMLQDTAIDSDQDASFFDSEIDEFTSTIAAEAKDIVEFYLDCRDNTLLKINLRQREQDYLNQISKIYKTVAEFVGAKFNEDFELSLALLHYELHVKKAAK